MKRGSTPFGSDSEAVVCVIFVSRSWLLNEVENIVQYCREVFTHLL